MNGRTFVGFGFGPIQAGLFAGEAYRSGNFSRLVVAEVAPEIVDAVRSHGGEYRVNVATRSGIEVATVRGVEIFNPQVASDRDRLIEAVAEAQEIATALPSVDLYGRGEPGSVVDILAAGLLRKAERTPRDRAIIYTGENHNHAAEILNEALTRRLGAGAARSMDNVHCLNTVIGKMSGVVTDDAQIRAQGLARAAGAACRAFLVEAFNRILITRIRWPEFPRGIAVFEEKDDLLPFEEAKLYGHNAVHALLGYLAHRKGYRYVAEVASDRSLTALAREAFLDESGLALCGKHGGVDPLFTAHGFRAYAEDLLARMMNPHLRDSVERVIRDPRRKLGWDDRLIGTMRLALGQGIRPLRFALAAAAALRFVSEAEQTPIAFLPDALWRDARAPAAERQRIKQLIVEADGRLNRVLGG